MIEMEKINNRNKQKLLEMDDEVIQLKTANNKLKI